MTERRNYQRVDVERMRIGELLEAFTIWRAQCGPDRIPIWGELHFLDFNAAILPRVMLLDVDDGPGFGRYRYWGTAVASANGRDMTGLRVSELAPPRHARYSEEQYRWVVSNASPALFVACLGEKSWDRKYEAVLRMPCRSSSESDVDRVLSIGYYADDANAIEDFIDVDIRLDDLFNP